MDKSLIRKTMKEKRLSLNQETFSLYNQSIFQKLITHPLYTSSKLIGTYVSLPDEVDTLQFIQTALINHRVCVPKIEKGIMNFYEIYSLEDLKEGHFHVLEPTTDLLIEPNDIDFMVVPLLAYDFSLYRVGYGKGYYDRYFSKGFQGYKLGLAFSFQFVDKINIDQYDYPLDEMITE